MHEGNTSDAAAKYTVNRVKFSTKNRVEMLENKGVTLNTHFASCLPCGHSVLISSGDKSHLQYMRFIPPPVDGAS